MKIVGLIIVFTLAASAFFIVYKMQNTGSSDPVRVVATQEPDFQEVEVLVASRRINVGEKIESSMLDSQPWPEHLVVGNFITSGGDSTKAVGLISRSYFQPGEPIILSKLANPGDPGFLAAALSEGKRMMTISTDGVAGLAGFVAAGDYVDVMITHPIPSEELNDRGEVVEQTVTETLLQGLKILAVDQRATSEQADPDERIDLPSSVSLEVSLNEAQQIRLAQDVGYVSLALRGIDAKGDDVTSVTQQQDITKSDVYEKVVAAKAKFKAEQAAADNKDVVKIIRGTEVEEVESKPKAVADALSTLEVNTSSQQ